jgi:hypothetical protein
MRILSGFSTIRDANATTSGGKVAEKNRHWQLLGRTRLTSSEWALNDPSIMLSASSRTNTLSVLGFKYRRLSHSPTFPGVPTTRWASTVALPCGTRAPAMANSILRPAMLAPMGLTALSTIWTASSRVGVTHSACAVAGSSTRIRYSIPSVKAAVLPEPDWACPITFRGGSARIRGRASSWIALGRSNPMAKMASSRYGGRLRSWKVLALDRCEAASLWITLSLSLAVSFCRSRASFCSLLVSSSLSLWSALDRTDGSSRGSFCAFLPCGGCCLVLLDEDDLSPSPATSSSAAPFSDAAAAASLPFRFAPSSSLADSASEGGSDSSVAVVVLMLHDGGRIGRVVTPASSSASSRGARRGFGWKDAPPTSNRSRS